MINIHREKITKARTTDEPEIKAGIESFKKELEEMGTAADTLTKF